MYIRLRRSLHLSLSALNDLSDRTSSQLFPLRLSDWHRVTQRRAVAADNTHQQLVEKRFQPLILSFLVPSLFTHRAK